MGVDTKEPDLKTAKTIKVDEDGGIALSSFSNWIDTSKVEFYDIEHNKNKTITIKFYDKKKKLIKPYGPG
jgi:hypothetical protein